ncbi:hypothetical protein H0E87_002361 [Populus deltoides]|uniref:Uncharacterized protein n=1 Tax=Populus deltoides TaxID=3696 RepID=A0A8T2ZVC2_POPDE|nr:hypothetical protein H0E87_002361 [Populus deltoides]
MRKVLHVNGMGKNIKILNIRSDKLHIGVDIPSQANVLQSIVSAILDSELLGEGLIPIQQHAHDMLLVDNPLDCSISIYDLWPGITSRLLVLASNPHILISACVAMLSSHTVKDGIKLNVPAKGAE